MMQAVSQACYIWGFELLAPDPQEKEQALVCISENARRHIQRSRADKARTYDTLLKQYRQAPFPNPPLVLKQNWTDALST